MITFILALIGIFGTLTIVACLRQVEDGIAELQQQAETTVCPVCMVPHNNPENKSLYSSLKKSRGYYSRKRKAISKYCNLRKRKKSAI